MSSLKSLKSVTFARSTLPSLWLESNAAMEIPLRLAANVLAQMVLLNPSNTNSQKSHITSSPSLHRQEPSSSTMLLLEAEMQSSDLQPQTKTSLLSSPVEVVPLELPMLWDGWNALSQSPVLPPELRPPPQSLPELHSNSSSPSLSMLSEEDSNSLMTDLSKIKSKSLKLKPLKWLPQNHNNKSPRNQPPPPKRLHLFNKSTYPLTTQRLKPL